MSGYRSKRVANTRTAMGTTDQRPTGSGAVMLGLTGSGPGSSPWARRAAQRRAYTSMLQKKCAEGDKASCINPVAVAAAAAAGGLGINSVEWMYRLVDNPDLDTSFIGVRIEFKNNSGAVDITSPADQAVEGDLTAQFELSVNFGMSITSGNGTYTVFTALSANGTHPNSGGDESVYNLVGSGSNKGKIEIYWRAEDPIDIPPVGPITITLKYNKDSDSALNLKVGSEVVQNINQSYVVAAADWTVVV